MEGGSHSAIFVSSYLSNDGNFQKYRFQFQFLKSGDNINKFRDNVSNRYLILKAFVLTIFTFRIVHHCKAIFCKVVYALIISSISRKTHVYNIMSYCYSSLLGPKGKPQILWSILGVMPYVVMQSVVIELSTECHDWSCSIKCFYFSAQLISLIEST